MLVAIVKVIVVANLGQAEPNVALHSTKHFPEQSQVGPELTLVKQSQQEPCTRPSTCTEQSPVGPELTFAPSRALRAEPCGP